MMTLCHLKRHAREYIEEPDLRQLVIATVHAGGGRPALEALANLVGVSRSAMLAYAAEYYRDKRRWRRKFGNRRQYWHWDLPPAPRARRCSAEEAREMAAAEAGGQVPVKAGKRNSFAKTVQNKSRKMR